jgi:hypothetical protein
MFRLLSARVDWLKNTTTAMAHSIAVDALSNICPEGDGVGFLAAQTVRSTKPAES